MIIQTKIILPLWIIEILNGIRRPEYQVRCIVHDPLSSSDFDLWGFRNLRSMPIQQIWLFLKIFFRYFFVSLHCHLPLSLHIYDNILSQALSDT